MDTQGFLPTLYRQYPLDKHSQSRSNVADTNYNLHNDVHPIFARHKFSIASHDYEIILPALKLASLFISTDSLLQFWAIMFRGRLKQVPNADGSGDTHAALFPPHEPLTPKDIAETKLVLLNMSQITYFVCVAHENPDVGGVTFPHDDRLRPNTNPACCDLCSFHGYASAILFAKSKFTKIEMVYNETVGEGQGFTPELLRLYFEFAFLLLHELAHA